MDLRNTALALQHQLANKSNTADAKAGEKKSPEEGADGETTLSDFMRLAGEPITWIEARELWNDMRSTNNGSLPKFRDAFMDCSAKSLRSLPESFMDCSAKSLRSLPESTDHTDRTTIDVGTRTAIDVVRSGLDTIPSNKQLDDIESPGTGGTTEKKNIMDDLLDLSGPISTLSEEGVVSFAHSLAIGIKEKYSIRLSDDKSELKFIIASLSLLWSVVFSLGIASYFNPDNTKLGSFTPAIFVEAFALFGIELIWECILSWVVLRFNIKINYTRKFGNLIKVPKYFVGDFLPYYTSSALSMTMALAVSQTLFAAMFYRKSREKFKACAYVFLSQDRREDRPDTLIFQVTEDIMRFAIYFPFKLLVVDLVGSKALIFIPIAVNNIGDGLAEPVGVAFGKHKYTTTALYHKGQFFKSKFTRSYEGSACVFITTMVVVAANYNAFNPSQFWITFSILPFLMTIAEAKAPHTNDGPFMALVGCGFLSAVFLL